MIGLLLNDPNDVNGAARVSPGDTASGRGGSEATPIVNKRKPRKSDANGAARVFDGDTASGRGGGKATQTVIERNPCKQTRKSKDISLRVGTVNIGSMSRRSGEVVDMAGRRDLDFCCLQETRWKGGSARVLGRDGARYKFFWSGCEEMAAGVGILVAERWIKYVLEVRRVSERLMVLRVMVGKSVLNLVSAYAPQVGRLMEEKEEFLVQLGTIFGWHRCQEKDDVVWGFEWSYWC